MRRIEVGSGSVRMLYPLNPLPEQVFETMLTLSDYGNDVDAAFKRLFRINVYEAVVCTYNNIEPFPVNTSSKEVFLVPRDEIIEQIIDDLEGKFLSFQGRPFEDTLEERFQIFRDIYLEESKIERFNLGSIEIFGGRTYRHLLQEPKATLHLSWREGRIHPSYQLNTIVEIFPRGTTFYRFARFLRQLFSRRYLDLLGKGYVCAYKFWICETKRKDLTARVGF